MTPDEETGPVSPDELIEELPVDEAPGSNGSSYSPPQEVVMKWQTCDDDCPSASHYRIIVRELVRDFGLSWPEIVRQKKADGEWKDDEVIGEPGLDGSYSLDNY